MKTADKLESMRLACIIIFAVHGLRSISSVVNVFTSGIPVLVMLSSIMLPVMYILLILGLFQKKYNLIPIGFGIGLGSSILRILAFPKLLMLLKISYISAAVTYALGISVCMTKGNSSRKLSFAMIGFYLVSILCPLFVYNSDYLPTAISSNAWIWVLFIAAYAMLPSVLHGSGIKEELPFLKDFPEVTFSEVLSTYIATLIIPTAPMCLVLLFVHPVVSLLTLIFLPVAFTYAHLKDKPLREKEEAERSRIQSKLFAMQFAESFRRGENPITNAPQVDTDRLRNDLMNHYGTAMHNGFPMAQADLVHVQGASDAELIAEAKKSGFDLNKYTR